MPTMDRRRRTRKGFLPPVVSTQAEKGIRRREPEREGTATRKPISSGVRSRIPLRLFAVGPNRETAAKPMKNPRVAPARPWPGVPTVSWPGCNAAFRGSPSTMKVPATVAIRSMDTKYRPTQLYFTARGIREIFRDAPDSARRGDVDPYHVFRRTARLPAAAVPARSAVRGIHRLLHGDVLDPGGDSVAGRPVLDLPSPRDPLREGAGCDEVFLPVGLRGRIRLPDLGRGADSRHHIPEAGKGGLETDGQRREPGKDAGSLHHLRIRTGGADGRGPARPDEHPLRPHRNERGASSPASAGRDSRRPGGREAS